MAQPNLLHMEYLNIEFPWTFASILLDSMYIYVFSIYKMEQQKKNIECPCIFNYVEAFSNMIFLDTFYSAFLSILHVRMSHSKCEHIRWKHSLW